MSTKTTPPTPTPASGAADQQFLFDDFFVADDNPGIEATVVIRGRTVPLRIKPALTTADQTEAQQAAVRKRMTPDGKIVIDAIDESRLNSEIMARVVVSWPFTHADGTPVPVTAANCSRMVGEGGEALAKIVQTLLGKQTEVIAPFGPTSDAA